MLTATLYAVDLDSPKNWNTNEVLVTVDEIKAGEYHFSFTFSSLEELKEYDFQSFFDNFKKKMLIDDVATCTVSVTVGLVSVSITADTCREAIDGALYFLGRASEGIFQRFE